MLKKKCAVNFVLNYTYIIKYWICHFSIYFFSKLILVFLPNIRGGKANKQKLGSIEPILPHWSFNVNAIFIFLEQKNKKKHKNTLLINYHHHRFLWMVLEIYINFFHLFFGIIFKIIIQILIIKHYKQNLYLRNIWKCRKYVKNIPSFHPAFFWERTIFENVFQKSPIFITSSKKMFFVKEKLLNLFWNPKSNFHFFF